MPDQRMRSPLYECPICLRRTHWTGLGDRMMCPCDGGTEMWPMNLHYSERLFWEGQAVTPRQLRMLLARIARLRDALELTSARRCTTVSYMTPDEEARTITVRLDSATMTRLANLTDYFTEHDPLGRDVPLSDVVRRAINEFFDNTFGKDNA